MTKESKPQDNIIFLHLPKTAGSTINHLLDRQYAPETVYTIEEDTLTALKEFEGLPLEIRQKIRVVKGHVEYGVHKFLHGETKYITFLRNPIERVISDYYFILRAPETPYHRFVTENNLSLKEAVECQDPLIMMPNSQSILLAGMWRTSVRPSMDDILDQAKQNLRNHFIVGLTEQFDESICLLKSNLHWNNDIYYQKRNVTAKRPMTESLPADTLKAIVQTNLYDLELYQFGQALFAKQIKQRGVFFPTQVRFYKLLNKAHEYKWFLQLLHIWHGLKNNWFHR